MNTRSRIDTVLERANWIAGVVVAIIAYLAFAYAANWWPFLKDAQKIQETGLTMPNSPTPSLTPKPSETPRATATPTLGIGSSKISPIDGAIMMYVPAGEFLMGSNDYDSEKPPHPVYLDAFWVDKFEVTNAYKKMCERWKMPTPQLAKILHARFILW